MKKIGILTFHAAHNNGSMLQALALQTMLEKAYEGPVEIVDFSNEAQKNMYAPLPKPTNWKRAIKWLIWATNHAQMKKQHKAYVDFTRKYLHLSEEKHSTRDELEKVVEDYAAFVAGSDQVWNTKCMDADDAYYLHFAKNAPKYAYAVSFGANNPFEIDCGSGVHRSYFEAFNKVSVREKNAQRWIQEETGVTVPICLDPTMLMDKEEWETLVDVGRTPVISGKYIFYYCFSITEEVQRFLKRVSAKTKLPVYFMEAKEWTLKTCWKNGIKLIGEYGPDVYMNVVKNAEIFITTSFHGTAFAAIYRKNFWYIRSKDSESSKDDRATSFLTQLNLLSRYKTMDELSACDLGEAPDYAGIDETIRALRADSLAYLQSIVEEIKK